MIRHIVLIRFRPDVSEAKIAELFEELHRIEDKLPGLIGITSGRSDSPEKMERGYMHGFVADFSDWDGLQAYQDHPEHQALGAKLVDHAVDGKEGILCFDLPVDV
ncbi:Dabb family protein [Pseudoponticoccus marisrubri]|uniref:Stress responsive protein n=1 Tax=Pseudoponticoccus marisrubri TaxID=1685382 RepID=A0A0W7WJI2_9RHOB|nr:Dabb family protein [Pseudoponticoccus marisrubri]KUF10714.1 stress responsive protein [Pseudoponticoccus marisrubri]